jgi:hypothetical protein
LEGSFVEQSTGGAHVPFVFVSVQSGQFGVGHRAEVNRHRFVGWIVLQSVDAAVVAFPTFGIWIVTVLAIVPVDGIDGTVRTVLQVDGHVFGVGAKELILAGVNGLESGTEPVVDLLVHLMTAQIVGEEVTSKRIGPVVPK